MTRPPSRRALWLGFGLVLLGGFALLQWAVPRILATGLVDAAGAALGRQVAIGDLAIGWLPGRLTVTDLEIGGPLDAPPLPPEQAPIRFARLALDLSWSSLLAGEIHLTDLALEAPTLYFERDDAGALAPLVLAQLDAEPEPEPGDGGWPVRLDALAVRDLTLAVARTSGRERREVELGLAELTLSDLSLRDGAVALGAVAFQDPGVRIQRSVAQTRTATAAPPPGDVAARPPAGEAATRAGGPGPLERHRLEALDVKGAEFTLLWEGGTPLAVGLDLSARGVSAAQGERFPVEIGLGVEGGSIGLEGELGIDPLVFDGTLRWEALPLARLLEASGVDAGVELASGSSTGALRVALAGAGGSDGLPQLQLSGDVQVSDLDASRPDLELAWSTLSIAAESIHVPMAPGEAPVFALSRVVLVEPRIDYVIAPPAPSSDASEAPEAMAPAAAEDGAPQLSIDVLEVDGGTLRFRDRTPREPFETLWRKLTVRGRGLRWPERDAESLTLAALGSGGSRLAVDASLRGGRGRIETRLDQMALAPLDPYAAEYTGIRIDEGRGTVRSLLEIAPTRVRTDSVVDLHRLRVREEEAGWFQSLFGMPLDVALALLRDLDGDIRVPVSGEFSGDTSKIDFVSLLASTLRQAVVGAVSSPLKLLGSMRDTAGDLLGSGLEPIEVVTGGPDLQAEQYERLETLARMLDDKPGLVLALQGRSGPADDPGIARRRLIAQAKAGDALDGQDRLGFLERRRVRNALADLDPDAPVALDPELEALVQKLVGTVRVDDAARRSLARERATRARRTLVEELGAADAAVLVEEGAVGQPGVTIELRARGDASG